jgi:hypothetical protein
VKKNVPTDKALYARVKAEAKRKFAVYPCVPLDSFAITKMGLASHEDIFPGEEILAYDRGTGDLVWSEVEHVNFYEKAPLLRLRKAAGFSLLCTPGHKWVVESRANKNGRDFTKMVAASDLNRHQNIIWCGNPLAGQSEGLTKYWSNKWSKKDEWIHRVIAMTPLEREVFLASAIIYDGCEQGRSKVREGGMTFAFSQKNINHFWATVLAAFCNGYYVSTHKKNKTMMGATIIRGKKFHSTQNLIKEEAGAAAVWCPSTKHETWVMVQGGVICVTGNSAYANSWLVREYKKRGGGYRARDVKGRGKK